MNMNHPKISIIIPVYNCGKYLNKCLDSLINQSLKDFEIICVDDGSTDSSGKIVTDYSERESRIKKIYQEHNNAGAARNLGFSYANGKYVIFLDADDFFEEDMLEKLYSAAISSGSDITICRSDAYLDDTGEFLEQNWTIRKNNNIFLKYVGWDKLIDASLIRDNNLSFQEIRSSNDMSFTFTVLSLTDNITIIDDVLVHHRVNNNNSISNTIDISWNCFYLALKQLKGNLIHFGKYNRYKKDFINYVVHFSLWHIHRLNGENKKKAVDLLRNEGLQHFEIADKKHSYFDDRHEYISWRRMLNLDITSYDLALLKYYGIVQSIKDNGFLYTVRRVLFHLHLAKDNDPLRTMEKKDE